jgi:S1-C subfamily serine protease
VDSATIRAPVVQPAKPAPEKDIKPPAEKDIKPPAVAADVPPKPRQTSDGRLSAQELERVKRATVFLRVTMADGGKASGSGFFGSKESPNLLLTNAHVVGMLSPDSVPPQAIEAVINSGQRGEWTTRARVLGVDRSSDLAVLDIGTPARPVPEPLTVKSAGGIKELDKLYVFGFPFGEQLGKEITVSETSVSSLRKKSGSLDRVQVNGGMNPGNSGGPLVDPSGDVVGVAVSGIPGRQINFAIPGDRVHIILNGRISGMSYHQPYFGDDNKIIIPAVMDMIDPRRLIKEVGVDIWVGNKPANAGMAHRPPATTQPPARPGDSAHAYFPLKYEAPQGTGDILLPELPPGKVYWHQPKWTNASGETHWASANLLRLPTEPVSRKPANLVLSYPQGAKRALDLFIENTFKVSNDDDSGTFQVRTRASFSEIVEQTGANGSRLKLIYRLPKPTRDLVVPGGKTIPSRLLEQLKDDLPKLITTVQVDHLGTITRQSLDPRPLAALARTRPQQVQLIKDFHEMVQQGLESLSLSLPASGAVKPLETWKAQRHLPIDTPGKYESGKLDVTFTYLGVRNRAGREEAVIGMKGMVLGKGDAVSGKADGRILVDLATGQTLLAETTVMLELEVVLNEPGEAARKLRVLATIKFRMQRQL